MRLKRIGLLALLSAGLLVWRSAAAQFVPAGSPFSLTLSPVYLTLDTAPGGSVSGQIKLRNNTTSPLSLVVGLKRFRAYNDSGQPLLLDLEPTDPFPSWVDFSADSFTIGASETETVTVTISPPADAALGYYYAVTFTNPTEAAAAGGQAGHILGSSAVLILLSVTTTDIRKEIAAADFRADRFWYDFLPVTFSVGLQNTGNIHLAPTGNIFIERGGPAAPTGGPAVATLIVNEEGGNILPDSTRVFTAAWEDGWPRYQVELADGQAAPTGGQVAVDEKGKPQRRLTWSGTNFNQLRFGRYTAQLLMVYDNVSQDIPITGSATFWVIPWQILLALLFILALAAVGLIAALRYLARQLRRRVTHA